MARKRPRRAVFSLSALKHLERLGTGGHASVHKARVMALPHIPRDVRGKVVAVKVYDACDPRTNSRIWKSAHSEFLLFTVLDRHPHPNIVHKVAQGTFPPYITRRMGPPSKSVEPFLADEDDDEEDPRAKRLRGGQSTAFSNRRMFEVLEYMPRDLFSEIHDADDPMPMSSRRIAWVSLCVARALAHLHGIGWVHNDLKPENILVDHDAQGEVKVCDLGFSVRCESDAETRHRMAGTHDYNAPEIFRCASHAHNPRALDRWQLGVIMAEMINGQFPFKDTSKSALAQSITRDEVDFSDSKVDSAVVDVARGFLAKDPQQRLRLPDAIRALEAWLEAHPEATPASQA